MQLQLRRHRVASHPERGQVTAWAVGISLVLFGFMAFTTDMGFWLVERRTQQNQADAAVLAGMQGLPNRDTAAALAQEWLERNGEAESVCDEWTQPSEYTEIYQGFAFVEASTDFYTKIRVCVSGPGLLVFSPIFDLAGVEVRAVAAANLQVEPSRYALMAMNESDCSLAPTLSVLGGGSGVGQVHLLGDSATYTALDCGSTETFRVAGNMTLEADYHDYCGATTSPHGNAVLEGDLNDGICGVPDPWASNDLYPQPEPGACITPASRGWTDFIFANETQTLQPGTYCQLVQVNGSDETKTTINLAAGTYIFRGGFMATGGKVIGDDVVLYFTCPNGDSCADSTVTRPVVASGCSTQATFCVQGKAWLDITSPEEIPHIAVWVDRTATAPPGESFVRMAGQGNLNVDGHIYALGGGVQIQGQNASFNFVLNGTILGDTINISGQGVYTVNWSEEFAPKIYILAFVE